MIGFINPRLLSHSKDVHSSGIPYLPHGLAYAISAVRERGLPYFVLDLFGEEPFRIEKRGEYRFQGSSPEMLSRTIQAKNPSVLIFYAGSIFNADALDEALQTASKAAPDCQRIVIGNTQGVIGYSLSLVLDSLVRNGATGVVLGEAEAILPALLPVLQTEGAEKAAGNFSSFWIPGKSANELVPAKVANLEEIPFPAWEDFPLKNYWKLRIAHGPTSGKYLAILSSRGCPLSCSFCSIPTMNQKQWRGRSVESVIAEIQHFRRTLGVREFHFEDVNPTVQEQRMLQLCKRLPDLDFKPVLKMPSGAKIDRFKPGTLKAMAEAGFHYLSVSPETGSPDVLRAIGKSFDHRNALKILREYKQSKGSIQACFILGHPNETARDRAMTLKYVRTLARAGIDEIAVYMVCPMPGTPVAEKIVPPEELSQLTFTPTWRSDFKLLWRWRVWIYVNFFALRSLFHPLGMLSTLFRALKGGPYRLKIEMLPRRLVILRILPLFRRPSFS